MVTVGCAGPRYFTTADELGVQSIIVRSYDTRYVQEPALSRVLSISAKEDISHPVVFEALYNTGNNYYIIRGQTGINGSSYIFYATIDPKQNLAIVQIAAGDSSGNIQAAAQTIGATQASNGCMWLPTDNQKCFLEETNEAKLIPKLSQRSSPDGQGTVADLTRLPAQYGAAKYYYPAAFNTVPAAFITMLDESKKLTAGNKCAAVLNMIENGQETTASHRAQACMGAAAKTQNAVTDLLYVRRGYIPVNDKMAIALDAAAQGTDFSVKSVEVQQADMLELYADPTWALKRKTLQPINANSTISVKFDRSMDCKNVNIQEAMQKTKEAAAKQGIALAHAKCSSKDDCSNAYSWFIDCGSKDLPDDQQKTSAIFYYYMKAAGYAGDSCETVEGYYRLNGTETTLRPEMVCVGRK